MTDTSSHRTPIEVRRYGAPSSRVPVVALHGGPGAIGALQSVARTLGERFEVHEPLQRAADGIALDVATHVRDLAEVAPTRMQLVGHSWGAMLALSFAARHPKRVASILLIGSGTYDEASRAAYQRRMAENLGPEGREQMDILRARVAAPKPPHTRALIFSQIGELATRAQAFDPIDGEEPAELAPVRFDPIGHRQTWDDALRRQRDGVEPQSFSAIRCPVLMLHGEHDPHPGAATFATLRNHMRDLRCVSLAACGHEPWLERHGREAFWRIATLWLEQQG